MIISFRFIDKIKS